MGSLSYRQIELQLNLELKVQLMQKSLILNGKNALNKDNQDNRDNKDRLNLVNKVNQCLDNQDNRGRLCRDSLGSLDNQCRGNPDNRVNRPLIKAVKVRITIKTKRQRLLRSK